MSNISKMTQLVQVFDGKNSLKHTFEFSLKYHLDDIYSKLMIRKLLGLRILIPLSQFFVWYPNRQLSNQTQHFEL